MTILNPTPRTMTIWRSIQKQKLERTTSTDEAHVQRAAKAMSADGNNNIYYVVDSDLGEIHKFYWQGVEYIPNPENQK